MIIGITGMPQIGKDTFYRAFSQWALTKKLSVTRLSIADAIRTDV